MNNKKGAMFGLDCRALKKQFGKLFLASRHSEAPQGASDSCGYAKRGAMFGLDARIALAIFGALSVISGAALYSAIQDAKVVSFIASLNEIEKAVEQYYLDNAEVLPIDNVSGSAHVRKTRVLYENVTSLSTWNGPYISAKLGALDYCGNFNFGSAGELSMCAYFCSTATNSYCASCTDYSLPYCTIFLEIYTLDKALLEKVDVKIDGEQNSSTGRVRIRDTGLGTDGSISLRYQLPKYN